MNLNSLAGGVRPRLACLSLALVLFGNVVHAEDSPGASGVAAPMPPPRFGSQGTFELSASTLGSVGRSAAGSGAATQGEIGGTLSYFVARNFSIALALATGFEITNPFDGYGDRYRYVEVNVSVGPRVGLNVPLGERFSFYPRATFEFSYGHSSDTSTTITAAGGAAGVFSGSSSGSAKWLDLNLFAPVLFHATNHLFVGAGPYLDMSMSLTPATVPGSAAYGAEAMFGGWWGGKG